MSAVTSALAKTPWHLWVVGFWALLWNGAGAFTIMMGQAGRLPGLSAEEAAYYAAQALWFVIVTDIALLSAVAGAVTVLMRSRLSVWAFALSLAAIVVTNVYDIASGTSRMLADSGARIATIIIFVIAVLELAYASRMKTRAVLR